MANYELTIIAIPQTCEVKVDGRAPHYLDHRTGTNSWHTHLGNHNVVLRLNGVELHLEVNNSDGRELTVYFGTVPEHDASSHPGSEVNMKDVRYVVDFRDATGQELKRVNTRNNVLAAGGFKKGTYYVKYSVRITKHPTPDHHSSAKPKLRVTG